MARAIVTFARGWQALAITRSLGRQGIEVFCGEENPFAPCFFSRYCQDSFVYPSVFEGFGLPPLEAAACGTPVVASNVTALPEVLGDAALLVDPEDTDAIAQALRRLLEDDDLRADLRQRGLQRAAGFTWDAVAERVVRGYRQADAGRVA